MVVPYFFNVKYLSNYVSGNVISDRRLVSDDGRFVTVTIKDYKDGGIRKSFVLEGAEFTRRIAMHVLPRRMARVRYSGIFAPCEQQKKLAVSRQLIGQSNESQGQLDDTLDPASPFEREEEEDIEEEPQLPKCHCRYCKGEMELLGHLRGTETQAMRRLAQDTVSIVTTSLLNAIGDDAIKELLSQLRIAWLITKLLPSCIRHLFCGQRLTSIECGILEAFVIEELRLLEARRASQPTATSQSSLHLSGIPPPHSSDSSTPLEPEHAA